MSGELVHTNGDLWREAQQRSAAVKSPTSTPAPKAKAKAKSEPEPEPDGD